MRDTTVKQSNMVNKMDNKKTGYVSATLDEYEDQLLNELASMQGIGRATAIKLLLREKAPSKIAELSQNCQEKTETSLLDGDNSDKRPAGSSNVESDNV